MTPLLPQPNQSWVVYLSTFPPRECGIATFTQDLATSVNKLFAPYVRSVIVAMNENALSKYSYSKQVIMEIDQENEADYVKAALKLNALPQIKVINIQHEFGIFGGSRGRKLFSFVDTVTKPIVLTCHTVLGNPDDELKDTIIHLAEKSAIVVVMTNLSKEILKKDYGIDPEKIKVIPHGLHPTELTTSKPAKAKFNLSKRTVLSTFGLLSKHKGQHFVLEALPEIIKKFPDVIYLIIGATHPDALRKEGESYRNALTARASELGLQNHVRFYNKYLSLPELLEFLQATDIYLSTPLDPNQAVSGTLTYALGAGRPVVATSFSQAKEVITPDVGRLVPFESPESYVAAISELLADKPLREQMGRNAYFATRSMTWPNVALAYMQAYSYLIPELRVQKKNLPKIKLHHLLKMTDEFGLFQFSKLSKADPSSGYTVDDNARALVALCMYAKKNPARIPERLIKIYLNFIRYTSQPDGYFRNYVDVDKTFNKSRADYDNLEGPTSRALLALATAATTEELSEELRKYAQELFLNSLKHGPTFTHLRAVAQYSKALSVWYGSFPSEEVHKALEEHAQILVKKYNENATAGWKWFENELTYANGLIPEGLLYAYQALGSVHEEWKDAGVASVDFLISQVFKDYVYIPIGSNGWYKKGGERALYDQQPEDPCAMVQVLDILYKVTKEEKYKMAMERAFYWYLGNNIRRQSMYDEMTGGCYDGLQETSINLNEGAEAQVSYLIARLTV